MRKCSQNADFTVGCSSVPLHPVRDPDLERVFLFTILEFEWLVQNAFATFSSFCPWEQNGWNGVLSLPEYECRIKECAHFTFWPFSFQNCEQKTRS